jgi:hypothetical protein
VKTSNIVSKIKNTYQEKRLGSIVKSRLKPHLQGVKHIFSNPADNQIMLHCPEYVEPAKDSAEIEIVGRIFQSFKKMKVRQQSVSDLYIPSSMWQAQLDQSYFNLAKGLKLNDLDEFHFFLANFGAWKTYPGIESTTLIRQNMTTVFGRKYLENVIFYKNLKIWQWVYNNRKKISSLSYPTHGNQCGAYIDNNFVGPGAFFNEIYGSILNGLVDKIERPIIADLGAGYGKLAYFTLDKMENSCFIDFDLPETLCLAAYFLMKTWPNKKTLLFGEAEYSEQQHEQYDLIFMPSFEMENLGQRSVDLFINKNSLGEMTREAAANYVNLIVDSTRYFFHMNHDNFPNRYLDTSLGLLGYEYPVPEDKFKLLFRYPDIGHILHKGGLDFDMDIFFYLYERR